MGPSYTFSLTNDRKKWYDRLALFTFLLNVAGLLIRYFYVDRAGHEGNPGWLFYGGALLLLVYMSGVLFLGKTNLYLKTFAGAAFALVLFWIYLGPWWVAVLNFLLISFYLLAQREMVIHIDEKGVQYPSFPVRTIAWNQLNNVILKDELLTIDCRNNTLLQHYPEKKRIPANEQDFNEFCRLQLEKYRNK